MSFPLAVARVAHCTGLFKTISGSDIEASIPQIARVKPGTREIMMEKSQREAPGRSPREKYRGRAALQRRAKRRITRASASGGRIWCPQRVFPIAATNS